MNDYSTFPKGPKMASHHQMVWCHIQHNDCEKSYPSAEIQLAYSTVLDYSII